MSVISGRKVSINNIPALSRFQINRTASTVKYAASSTGFGTGVTKGNINVAGSMSGVGGNLAAALTPGTELAFVGIADQGPNLSYGGTILISSLSINVDIEAGGLITWACNFGFQGDVTVGTAAAVAETDFGVHDGSSDGSVIIEATPSNFIIPNVRKYTININAPEKTYVENRLTLRKPGNLEADVSIDVYSDTLRNVNYDPNVLAPVRFHIGLLTYWRMEWIRFKETSNFVLDRSTQALLGYTINGDWSSLGPAGSVALGHITRPDTTHLFGT